MSTAICFDHVSKKFTLHHQRPRSFQDAVIRLLQRDGEDHELHDQAVEGIDSRGREEFWALRDVSFTVRHGETIGIVGPNGAGKSTVLKLISRIIEPTSGEVEVNGRVGALLELGAGFHPDLSGLENIYLNGSILGLRRAEIDKKLDSIVGFAELERFIDMPVKHYSSGMRMRLGFSIAAQVDADILLIDEVLAVGDISFQRKCLERIDSLQREGVTIVFVSHSVEQIADLCERALWLDRAVMHASGPAEQVIGDYLSSSEDATGRTSVLQETRPTPRKASSLQLRPYAKEASNIPIGRRRWGNKDVLIKDVRLLGGGKGDITGGTFHPGQSARVEVDYMVRSPLPQFPAFGIAICRADGVCCYGTNTALDAVHFPQASFPAAGTVTAKIPILQLLRGTYTLDVAVHHASGNPVYDYIEGCLSFEVQDQKGDRGVFRPDLQWTLQASG